MATKIKNISGIKRNHLTGVQFDHVDKFGQHWWIFQCDCGKKIVRPKSRWTVGDIQSCGCQRHSKLIKDITGQKFNRLTAIKRIGRKGSATFWLFRCDCGNEKEINMSCVISNTTKSCGCLFQEFLEVRKKEMTLEDSVYKVNRLLGVYKGGAKRRGFKFQLTRSQFQKLIEGDCFYCNKSPSSKVASTIARKPMFYNGIDRINSSLGYTINNCVSCCPICNQAKMEQKQIDFINWIRRIHNNLLTKGLIDA